MSKDRRDSEVVTYDMQRNWRAKNKEYIHETHQIMQKYRKKHNPEKFAQEIESKRINWEGQNEYKNDEELSKVYQQVRRSNLVYNQFLMSQYVTVFFMFIDLFM